MSGVLRVHGLRLRSGGRLWVSVCALLLALWLGVPSVIYAAANNAATGDQASQLEKLRTRIRALSSTLWAARGRRNSLQARLRATEQEIGAVSGRLRRLDGELRQQAQRLQTLERRKAHLETRLARERHTLADQLRAAYMMGRQEKIKLLLNQQDPGKVGRVLVYYDYLSRARAARIRAVMTRLDELRTVEQAIAQQTSALQRLRAGQREEKRALEANRRTRRRVLAALDAQIHGKGQELERLQRDARALRKLMDSLQRTPADIPARAARVPFATLKGRLPWPTVGRVIARYGQPRDIGNLKWHGVLIAAPAGGTVRSVGYGRVVFADWLRGLGLLIILDHGHGYMSLYAHNRSLYVKTGDWVKPGQVIASVGDSGGEPRPALYFEIRYQGRPVNPFQWCRGVPGEVAGLGR